MKIWFVWDENSIFRFLLKCFLLNENVFFLRNPWQDEKKEFLSVSLAQIEGKQGKTFSFLDAGRGLVASSIGIIGVIIFSLVVVNDISSASLSDKKEAFKYVIGVSSTIVFLIGILSNGGHHQTQRKIPV